ncbi:bestrophin family protein [Marinoscillum sp.]|uniref:bestrophin family protein n=1 Tax=Marinoscillum sp. TaxID=2024838 RepID=UPI003BA9025C
MYTRRNYGFWMTFNWSKRPFIFGLVYSTAVFALSHYLSNQIHLPWSAVTVIGIAVAFYLGFKNNSAYDRTWEARKIYGAIVNSSRSFAAAVVSFIKGKEDHEVKKELIHRHIAWMTALRHQLRLSKPWEHTDERLRHYVPTICESYNNKLDAELSSYISPTEIAALEGKTNKATQLLKTQSARLQELHDQGYFEHFRHMQFFDLVKDFYDNQGKAERIKNFPFPRQYASTALWITYVFAALVPFGIVDVFMNAAEWVYWVSPIFSALIIWVFFLMEKIGDYSENPFEGTYNDVPITQISRGIEIDIREMIGDDNIPGPIKEENGFLM